MAKYDWIVLEKEYILSDYKSVSAFLKEKGINNNGTSRKYTSGWKDKKRQKEDKKKTKTIEKVIEKQSTEDAKTIVKINDVANELLSKIVQANNELNIHLARNKEKTKTVKYDYKTNKPSKEIIDEKETITSFISIIDRKGLKELTSALKDLNDILEPKDDEEEEDNSFIEALNGKVEDIWNEEEE